MNETSVRKLAGTILILTPIAFNVFFTWLSMSFSYPDILREPAGTSSAVSTKVGVDSLQSGTGSC